MGLSSVQLWVPKQTIDPWTRRCSHDLHQIVCSRYELILQLSIVHWECLSKNGLLRKKHQQTTTGKVQLKVKQFPAYDLTNNHHQQKISYPPRHPQGYAATVGNASSIDPSFRRESRPPHCSEPLSLSCFIYLSLMRNVCTYHPATVVCCVNSEKNLKPSDLTAKQWTHLPSDLPLQPASFFSNGGGRQ